MFSIETIINNKGKVTPTAAYAISLSSIPMYAVSTILYTAFASNASVAGITKETIALDGFAVASKDSLLFVFFTYDSIQKNIKLSVTSFFMSLNQ